MRHLCIAGRKENSGQKGDYQSEMTKPAKLLRQLLSSQRKPMAILPAPQTN